jgi:hypothetical protein
VFQICTLVEHRPIGGVDSCIAKVPPWVYARVGDDPRVLVVSALGRGLRRLSEAAGVSIGETLHHADWWITDDAGMVERVGMHGNPRCVRCRASVDQALAALAAGDVDELLVGTLWWAGPSPPAG